MSIQTLLSPMTSQQVRQSWVNQLVTLGIPADQWVAGGVASTILTIIATTFASFQNLIVQAISSGFLNTASGQWLVLLAFYVYGVVAPAATFASGQLTLTNSGGGVYNFAPFTATFLNPSTGKTYQNVTAISLNGPSTQTITIQCTVAGTQGNAAPASITQLVTTMLDVTCSNASAVLGSDAITDANLRQLCLNKLGTLSVRGPASAYAYAVSTATGASSGMPVNINRSRISASSSTGTVTVYVASPSGPASADDVDGVINNIAIVAQPDAVVVNVVDATGVAYSNSVSAWCALNGVAASTMTTAIENALDTYFENFPIGGLTTDAGTGLFATGIDGVIGQAIVDAGGTPVSVEGTTDLALVPGQVATNNIALTLRTTS